jgi:hypothetical protein
VSEQRAANADESAVRRWGFTAAALLLLLLALPAMVKARPHPQRISHSCTEADSRFLNDARAALETFRLDGADRVYAAQDASAAAVALLRTSPSDPSLRQVRLLLSAMLVEYAHGHTYRFYVLQGEARTALVSASAPLHALGCNVDALL